MSKRTSQRIITKEARILKSMRARCKLSMRDAAAKSGLSPSLINVLENGRQDVLDKHLEILLPTYNQTLESFRLEVSMDESPMSPEHLLCLEMLPKLQDDMALAFSRILLKLCQNAVGGN